LARLSRLQFSGNYLNDDSLSALSRSPHVRQLTDLHLGRNNLTDRGLRRLIQSPNFSRLRQLNLSQNFITRIGALGLASAGQLAALSAVDFSHNLIDLEGIAALRRRFGDSLVCFGQGHLSRLERLVEFLERQGVPQGMEGYPEQPLERLEQWLARNPD